MNENFNFLEAMERIGRLVGERDALKEELADLRGLYNALLKEETTRLDDCFKDVRETKALCEMVVTERDALKDQVFALTVLGWKVDRVTVYDEEGIEGIDGWMWRDVNDEEHFIVGDWDELPCWPESAQVAFAKDLEESRE